ncbi:hypothetical protein APTSU1_000339500 [Apodemus speciosus]|uniref:Uncharacterized protein n=1 Tax=Apodemus speciosus TaxID=105296 RepID=A0ABQ0EMM8_APOSI
MKDSNCCEMENGHPLCPLYDTLTVTGTLASQQCFSVLLHFLED